MAVQGRAAPQQPRGPHCVGDHRTRYHIPARRGEAPAGSGRSPCGCQTTLQKDQDIEELRERTLFFTHTSTSGKNILILHELLERCVAGKYINLSPICVQRSSVMANGITVQPQRKHSAAHSSLLSLNTHSGSLPSGQTLWP